MISLVNVTKNYQSLIALENINTIFKDNSTTALLGKNGAGKTTLIKLITCQIFSDNGNIFFDGLESYEHCLEIKNKIGYVSESPLFYEKWNVKFFLEYSSSIRKVKSDRIDYIIDLFSLQDVLKKKICTLSKGYRQRLAFAQCMLHNPEYLILDEPFSALDPLQKKEMYSLIEKEKKDKCIIFSTHQISDIKNICDDVLILDKGKIVYNNKYNPDIEKFFNECFYKEEKNNL